MWKTLANAVGQHPYLAAGAGVVAAVAARTLAPTSELLATVTAVGAAGLVANAGLHGASSLAAMVAGPRGNPAVTPAEAAATAHRIGARLPHGVTPAALARGMTEEREHRDVTHGSPATTARIALAHLRERPDYYERLARAMRPNPFAGFADHGACVRSVAHRKAPPRSPHAYCAAISRRAGDL